MRVCFTGEATVAGNSVPDLSWMKLPPCPECNLLLSDTNHGCDLLVVADSSSQSGKARKARDYGIPVMTVVDFLNKAGS